MHANTLLLAAMASAAAAQVEVIHVLETLQVVPRAAQQAAAHALLARQDGSDAECEAALSDIIKDMPTLNSDILDYVQTAPAPTADCTKTLPLSFSEPLMEAITSFGHWGAKNSEKAMSWAANCDNDMEQLDSIINPGDFLVQACSTGGGHIVFTDASTTTTINMDDVIADLGREVMASMSGATAEGSDTTTASDASETGSSTGSDEASSTPSESAAESSGGADGDDGSGAANIVASAAAVAMAAVAGVFVAL